MLTSESTLCFMSIRKALSGQVQQMEGGYMCIILWLAIISSAEFSVWHLAKDSILISHGEIMWLPHKIKSTLLPRHRQKISGDRCGFSPSNLADTYLAHKLQVLLKGSSEISGNACASHYNNIPSRELGSSPTTALLLNSYGTPAWEVIL